MMVRSRSALTLNDMRTKATLFEYQAYPYQLAHKDSFTDGTLHLTTRTIETLELLNLTKPFIDLTRHTIKPLNYAGVVRVGGLTIEIFPKLFKSERYQDHRSTIAGNLLKMLSYSGSIPIKEMNVADLNLEHFDLFEIFIHIFAKGLQGTLRSSQKREYIERSDTIRVVKGRIDFRSYHNPCRMHIIPCDFFEFSLDNLLNRTLKYTCHLMARTVSDFSTVRILRSIVDSLDQVTLTPVTVAEIQRIPFTRLNQVFQPFIEICRIFLSHSTLTLQASEVESFSLLIPMEKLFEEFIAGVLTEDPTFFFGAQIPIQPQHYVGEMARDDDQRPLFWLRPDIVIGSVPFGAIIDTKYKALDPNDRKMGISQADVYQMYAYATKTGIDRCMLLYPEVLLEQRKNLTLPVPSPTGAKRDVLLMVRAIRLSHDLNRKEGWNTFRDELRAIVQPLIADRESLSLNADRGTRTGFDQEGLGCDPSHVIEA